jgi:predicted PurR-regulated permease PerM
MQMTYPEFLKRTLIFVAVAVLPFLIWYLFGVVLITIGAIILAMLLRLGAQPLVRWLSLPEPLALLISGVLVLGIIVGAGYLFGTRITAEFQDVAQRALSATADIHDRLEGSPWGQFLLDHFSGSDVSVTGVLSGLLKISSRFLEGLVIMVISAVYLAAQPRHYRDGLIWLVPAARACARREDHRPHRRGAPPLAARPIDRDDSDRRVVDDGGLDHRRALAARTRAYCRHRRVHPLCRAAPRCGPRASGGADQKS